MRNLAPKLSVLAAVCAASLAFAAAALAAPAVSGHFALAESEIGTNDKIVQGPEGNMWVTTSSAAKPVAKVTPAGATEEVEIGGGAKAWFGIALGPDKNLWATFEGGVARFNPANPKVGFKEFAVPAVKSNSSIVTGPDSSLWVATDGKLLRVPVGEPEKAVEFPIAGLNPRDIDVDGASLVVADFGEPRILLVSTAGAVTKKYVIAGGSQGVAVGAGGQIAFSQQGTMPEQVGLATPPGNPLLLTQEGDPFGVAYGSDAAFWVVRSGVDGVARVSSTGAITQLGGFPAGSMPRQIAAGPGNTMWVTLTNPGGKGEIGRISGLEPPAPPVIPAPIVPIPPATVVPQTTLGKKPPKVVKTTTATAAVKFGFSSSTAGASFECSLAHKVKPKGKAKGMKPRFVGGKFHRCGSPKTYRVTPGRYRFEARAVVGAARDSSPVTYGFSVVRVAKK